MENFLVRILVICSLGLAVVFLQRDVPGQSKAAAFAKQILALVLAFGMVAFYFATQPEEREYTLTCNQCGERFASDDPDDARICPDCKSAFMEEQLDQAMEEISGLDGESFRTVTCSKCGKQYLEETLTGAEEDPGLCGDCRPASLTQEKAEEGMQQFLDHVEQAQEKTP